MASNNACISMMLFNKSHNEAIKRAVFEVSQILGSGTTSAVPYDTAWVARIPKTDLSKPAFPECLQWLRDHQREDGSWGGVHPHTLHSNILNTFAGVLALSQWNYPEDGERKKRSVEALTTLAKTLPEIKTRDNIFEMSITGLMEDARQLELVIPYEKFKWCCESGTKELKEADRLLMSNKPNKYWALLEATSRSIDLELESFRPEISRYGLIASQPSTTAYILRVARLRRKNFPEAEWALKKLCLQNEGGSPHFGQCDNFEIMHGLDFLFKAGINPKINVKHAVTENALNVLKGRLNSSNGIGFSSNWQISDGECLSTALRVVSQDPKMKNNHEDGQKTDCCETMLGKKSKTSIEMGPLKDYPDLVGKNNVSKYNIDLAHHGGRNGISFVNKAFLAGKRNVSVFYNILETVFYPTHKTKNETDIIELIGRSQNDDGGWGDRGISTVGETAYICLAIFHLVQTKKGVIERIHFSKLADFMNNTNSRLENECFWCYKVNFCSPVVADATVAAAKYAIFQIQTLCVMTEALNENQEIRFFASEPWNVNNEIIDPGHSLLVDPEVPRHEIEVDKREVMESFNDIFQTKQNEDDYLYALLDTSVELSYYTYTVKLSPSDRAIDTWVMVLLFVIDYIFDVFLPKNLDSDFSEEVNQLFSVLSRILNGNYAHSDEVPKVRFPKFLLLAKGCFCFRKAMEEKGWNADTFVNYLNKRLFKSFALSYKLDHYGIDCSPKRYMEVHKTDIGNQEIIYARCILAGKLDGMTAFEQSAFFVKYIDYADKAGRLHADIQTIVKDVRLSRSDNYCLKLRDEYKISLQEAIIKANKKCNKIILKMFCLKKLILEDPRFKNNETLPFVLRQVEYGLYGGILWCISSPRYDSQSKFTKISRDFFDQKFDLLFVQNLCIDQ